MRNNNGKKHTQILTCVLTTVHKFMHAQAHTCAPTDRQTHVRTHKHAHAQVPIIQEALLYDIRRGPHSIGAHVRDAAAYVCWAFARAYEPHLLAGHVTQFASTLLTVACYDREINCRRCGGGMRQGGGAGGPGQGCGQYEKKVYRGIQRLDKEASGQQPR